MISAHCEGKQFAIRKLSAAQRAVTSATQKRMGTCTKLLLGIAKGECPILQIEARNAVRGLLRKSLGRKQKTYRGSGVVVGVVGARRGFAKQVGGKIVDPVRYGPIVESRTRFLQRSRD